MPKQKICILVAAHQPAEIPRNQLLIPIQVGTALAGQRLEGMCHDDEGENISKKNRTYCELTAQYYAWKNVKVDYYGFFHYRRYMNFAKEYPVMPSDKHKGKILFWQKRPYIEADSLRGDLTAYGLNEKKMRSVIEKYDVLTVLSERMDVTVYEQFCQFHDRADLDRMIRILKKSRPRYANACDAYMKQKNIYFCNMYIMKREYFLSYMKWLFPLLEEFEAEKDFTRCSKKQARVTGYLAERLFGVYYTWLKEQGLAACCELQYVIFGKADIRQFPMGKKGRKFHVRMRDVNRLLPAGTLRRRLVRRLVCQRNVTRGGML